MQEVVRVVTKHNTGCVSPELILCAGQSKEHILQKLSGCSLSVRHWFWEPAQAGATPVTRISLEDRKNFPQFIACT